MTVFIFVAALITLAALALLVIPLLRTKDTVSYERHAQNIHYAKERLQELEEQLKNASISATDYEALKLEIETTLAQDIDIAAQAKPNETSSQRRSNKTSIVFLSLSLPIMALAFYLMSGTPEALSPQHAKARPSAEQINKLVEGIEAKLAQNPDDIEGWGLLSRTYLSLGRYDDARRGYLRVIELGGETAANYAALADATALIARGEVTTEATQYIEQALALNPNSQQALWLGGLGAMQKGDKESARVYWQRLADLLDEMPQQQQELKQIMADSLGDPDGTAPANVASSDAATADSTQATINVTVSLSEAMLKQTSPEQTVFVFAKAANGPPAPLAVKRLTVADLPTSVQLSDSDAMMSQLTLSKFENLILTARVSKSGAPVAQSGDIQSEPINAKNTSKDEFQLVISSVVD